MLTRLSALPDAPGDSFYGLTNAGLRFDALPVAYDHRWITDFLNARPPGSPAHRTYHHRIEHGTWLTPDQAARGTVTCPGPPCAQPAANLVRDGGLVSA